MQRLQAKDNRLCLGCRADLQQFNTFKALEDPTHGGTGSRLIDLIGNGLLRRCQLFMQARRYTNNAS